MYKRVTILDTKDTDKRPKGDIKLWSKSRKTYVLMSRDGKNLGRYHRNEKFMSK